MINKERLKTRFERYVSCPSESYYELEMCNMVTKELRDLGGNVYINKEGHNEKSNGWNVYAYFKGSLEGEPILLCSHLDTVGPGTGIMPVIISDSYVSKTNTILGSDDKSGVAGIIEAIKTLKDSKQAYKSFEVLFTICEEVGLLGSKSFDFKKIRSKEAVVFDSSEKFGSIINESPNASHIKVTITGVASHAAIHPEKGVHALKTAVDILALIDIGKVGNSTTVNIANFKAPGRTNQTSTIATFEIAIRSFSNDIINAKEESIVSIIKSLCSKTKAEYSYTIERILDHFYIDPNDDLIIKVSDIISSVNVTPQVGRTYGGSDTNIINSNGIKAINISTGMQNVHSVSETIRVEELENTAQIAISLIKGVV